MILNVNAKSKFYEVQIGKIKFPHKGTIITDSNLTKFYPTLINKNSIILPAGEQSKSLENYFKIVNKLEDTNTILAFGGGVIGDLAGFCASTYRRGIDLIQIPTSLLAMIDSSIGGKNGVNLGERKNYLGTIYHPDKVIIDTLFLKTLPKKEFNNGISEAIKYYLLFDSPKLEYLENPQTNLENLIIECCKTKINVIEKEELDRGYRHLLNFGHTLGHAIELSCNLSHGEAISIGMVGELKIAQELGLIKNNKIQIAKELFKKNNLPYELPFDFDLEKAIELMKLDKKGKLVFSFDKDNYDVLVEEETIRKVLK
jgi:3-dehydroquinate synthase